MNTHEPSKQTGKSFSLKILENHKGGRDKATSTPGYKIYTHT